MRITYYRPLQSGQLLGLFGLAIKSELGIMLINGIKHCRSRQGIDFIDMPSQSYQKDGETKYKSLFEPYVAQGQLEEYKQAKNKLIKEIMTALNQHLKENPPQARPSFSKAYNGNKTARQYDRMPSNSYAQNDGFKQQQRQEQYEVPF